MSTSKSTKPILNLRCEEQEINGVKSLKCEPIKSKKHPIHSIKSEEEKEQEKEQDLYDFSNMDYLSVAKRSVESSNPISNLIGVLIAIAMVCGLSYGIGYLIIYFLYDYVANPTVFNNYDPVRVIISFVVLFSILILFIIIGYFLLKKEKVNKSKREEILPFPARHPMGREPEGEI